MAEVLNFRNIAIASAAALGALTMPGCSESTKTTSFEVSVACPDGAEADVTKISDNYGAFETVEISCRGNGSEGNSGIVAPFGVELLDSAISSEETVADNSTDEHVMTIKVQSREGGIGGGSGVVDFSSEIKADDNQAVLTFDGADRIIKVSNNSSDNLVE